MANIQIDSCHAAASVYFPKIFGPIAIILSVVSWVCCHILRLSGESFFGADWVNHSRPGKQPVWKSSLELCANYTLSWSSNLEFNDRTKYIS